MGIINLTKAMSERAKHPCFNCGMGSGDISQWTDPQTGDLMQESHGCSETCQLLKAYYKEKSEPLFGAHIRDTYRAIRGG